MNRSVKAASRHVLLAEFVLGVFLVAWGATKGVDTKWLASFARARYESGWILPTIIGALQTIAAAVEWFAPRSPVPVSAFEIHAQALSRWRRWWRRTATKFRRPWTYKELQRHVAMRAWFAGLAAVMWAYDLKEFYLDPEVLSAVVLILVAPVCVGVNLYSVYANRKVYVALDPNIPTSTLTFD